MVLIPSIRSKSQYKSSAEVLVFNRRLRVLIPSIRSKSQYTKYSDEQIAAYIAGLNPFYQV